jgi:hypothetical protein
MSEKDIKIVLPSDKPEVAVENKMKDDSSKKENAKDVDSKEEDVEKVDSKKEDEGRKDEEFEIEEPEKIDIDGVVYNLDKEGNALDDSGNIKYSKSQVDSFAPKEKEKEDDAEEVDIISEVIKRVNVVIEDDSGKPSKYENNIEGISKYISDVREKTKVEISSNVIGELFSNYPGLEEAYYYAKSNAGSLEGFTPQPDYSQIQVGDDVEQHKAIIYAERIAKGDSKARAERAVKIAVDEGLSKEEATEALEFLTQQSELVKQDRKRNEELAAQKEQSELQEYHDNVIKSLSSKKLNVDGEEIIIPEVLRVKRDGKIKDHTIKDFRSYIFDVKKYKVGNQEVELTQNQFDKLKEQSNRRHDHDVYEALRRFLGYDDSQLIKGAVAASKARDIRQLISKPKAKKVTSVSREGSAIKLPV